MPCTTTPAGVSAGPPTAREILDQLDAIDTRLYVLQHLFEFIADVTSAIPVNGQCDGIKAETITALFRWFSEEMDRISSTDMLPFRRFAAAIECPDRERPR